MFAFSTLPYFHHIHSTPTFYFVLQEQLINWTRDKWYIFYMYGIKYYASVTVEIVCVNIVKGISTSNCFN